MYLDTHAHIYAHTHITHDGVLFNIKEVLTRAANRMNLEKTVLNEGSSHMPRFPWCTVSSA